MNIMDNNQKIHHNKHYHDILNGGENSYYGFINSNSIWYWMHTYCMMDIDDFFNKIPKSSFLTLGDGYCGREASFIKKYGHNVHASDIETCLIELAIERNIINEFSQQDMNNLTLDDNSFDYSFVKESLHHLSKPYQGIYEMLRVSKRGVILIEPNGDKDEIYSFRNYEKCGNYSFPFSSNELVKVGLAYGIKHFAITYSTVMYGRHNIDNIKNGKCDYERNRLQEQDRKTPLINKPLLIFFFFKNEEDYNLLTDIKYKKIKYNK